MLADVTGKIDEKWRAEVNKLLQTPQKIHQWRAIIWDVIGESIFHRVQSFTELALALYSFAATNAAAGASLGAAAGASPPFSPGPLAVRKAKLSPVLTGFFRTARADDEMRDFLMGAIEYLRSFTKDSLEMPVSIIRAMHDVERLANIEESALPPEKLNLFRHCVLQIARQAGENG